MIREIAILTAITSCTAAIPAHAQGTVTSSWAAHLSVGSDYRLHGLSLVDDGLALALDFDYSHRSGWFAGAGAVNVDYASDAFRDSNRNIQLRAYAGYTWHGNRWNTSASIQHYRYPGSTIEYDYQSASISTVFRDRYFASIDYSADLAAVFGRSLYAEAGITLPITNSAELSIALGRSDIGGRRRLRFRQWNAGWSKLFDAFALDIRYYGTSENIRLPVGHASDADWVVTLSREIARAR